MTGRVKRIINGALAPLGLRVERVQADRRADFSRRMLPTDDPSLPAADLELNRVLNLLNYTKASESPYSAGDFPSAYHSVEIAGQRFRGQREPDARLSITPYDFTGKAVLDMGCNQGGMLFALRDRIGVGIGVDFDSRMINAANRLRAHHRCTNLHFYVFDLERESLLMLDNFRLQPRIDIVFLLSVCMWIANWRDVVSHARQTAPALLFESNGSDTQQQEQEDYIRSVYREVQLLQSSSRDDPGQQKRKLFLCDA